MKIRLLSVSSAVKGLLNSSPQVEELVQELFEEQGTPKARALFKQLMGFAPKPGSIVGYGSSDVNRTDRGGWIFMEHRGHMIMLVEPGTPSLDRQLFVKRKPNEYLIYVDKNLNGGPSEGYINPVPGTIITLTNEDSIKSYFKHIMTADYKDIEEAFRTHNTHPEGQKILKAWDENVAESQ